MSDRYHVVHCICCIFDIQIMKPFIVLKVTFKGYSRPLEM